MTNKEAQATKAVNWAVHLIENDQAKADPQIVALLREALEILTKKE